MSMPPMPFEYEGRDIVGHFLDLIFRAGRRFQLARTRANGQPAFGTYARSPNGARPAVGLTTISLAGNRICALTRFEHHVLPWFELPASLPSR